MAQSPAFGPTIWIELASAGIPAGVVQMFVPLDVLNPDGSLLYPAGTVLYAAGATADQRAAVQAVVAMHDPTKQLPPTVTGNQWAFALSNLSLAAAWRIGVTKSKDSDQVRIGLIARDTQLVATDPLLIRVAANAGTDGNGNALIAVPAVFATAQTMPL